MFSITPDSCSARNYYFLSLRSSPLRDKKIVYSYRLVNGAEGPGFRIAWEWHFSKTLLVHWTVNGFLAFSWAGQGEGGEEERWYPTSIIPLPVPQPHTLHSHDGLWKQLSSYFTVCRRMHPQICIKLHGMNPEAKYYLILDVERTSKHKYRYSYKNSSWEIAGDAERSPPGRFGP